MYASGKVIYLQYLCLPLSLCLLVWVGIRPDCLGSACLSICYVHYVWDQVGIRPMLKQYRLNSVLHFIRVGIRLLHIFQWSHSCSVWTRFGDIRKKWLTFGIFNVFIYARVGSELDPSVFVIDLRSDSIGGTLFSTLFESGRNQT